MRRGGRVLTAAAVGCMALRAGSLPAATPPLGAVAAAWPRGQAAQADPDPAVAGRLASLVDLTAMEYADAVAGDRVVNEAEYREATEFLAGAREALRALETAAGASDPRLSAGLDSLGALLASRAEPAAFAALAGRLVEHVAERWGAVAVREPSRPPSPAAGAALYRAQCADCHGPAGAGDGPRAAGMEPPPADLASPARRGEATPARDFQVLTYGIPATAMPGWGERLTDEERWDLVAHTQGLRYPAAEVTRGRERAASRRSPAAVRLPEWADLAASARLTDPELAAEIRAAWSAAGGDLLPGDAEAIVAFARSPAGVEAAGARAGAGGDVARSLDRVDSLVALAGSLDEGGDREGAKAAAVEAYLAFEAVERDLAARRPDAARAAELAFGGFRAAIGTADRGAAEAALEDRLEVARAALQGGATAWTLAVQSFFLILREGFEAILIVGALIAFLVKTGHGEARRTVHAGVLAAIAVSLLAAVALEGALRAAPARQEVLEGATMLLASLVLFSVSWWLLSRLDHRKWEAYLRERMWRALGAGGGLALAGVAFLAVFREGVETILFYRALLGFAGGGAALPVGLGFAAGCVGLAAIYLLFTRWGVRVPMRPFFAATSGVLYYMAVVFAGSGMRELQEAGVLSLTRLGGLPTVPVLGLYPTVETAGAQLLLVLLLGGALWLTFAPRGRAEERADARAEERADARVEARGVAEAR